MVQQRRMGQTNTLGAQFNCRRPEPLLRFGPGPHRQVRSHTTQGAFEKSLETDEAVLSKF
jgi:hypothetical protein